MYLEGWGMEISRFNKYLKRFFSLRGTKAQVNSQFLNMPFKTPVPTPWQPISPDLSLRSLPTHLALWPCSCSHAVTHGFLDPPCLFLPLCLCSCSSHSLRLPSFPHSCLNPFSFSLRAQNFFFYFKNMPFLKSSIWISDSLPSSVSTLFLLHFSP